ncbi:MAG: oxygenase MpaB family protein [Acidobacteria bacterium]|nr:oxygenase MpaB family protein [Acidobacteriota bacterium]
MHVPSAFAEGYEKAAAMDPALAHLYANYLRIGDPDADAVIADLAELPADEARRFLRAGIELDEDALRQAPESLQELIREAATLPAWYDREIAQRGCGAFLRNSDALLSAYIGGVMVEGFSTLLGRSYAATGYAPDDGVRWLKQELRQLLDTFLPRGIEPSGDGWRATLRFRIANAQARRLLGASERWQPDDWGVPISTAHVSLWAAARSARLLEFLPLLGVDLESRDREGIMTVLSCAAHVMGVPGALLFDNQEEGLRLFRVAAASEPPPGADAVAMANRIVTSVPAAIGIDGTKARTNLERYVYRISRELIGDETADELGFPQRQALSLLPWLRARGRIARGLLRFSPGAAKARDREAFLYLLRISDHDESEGVSGR